MVNDGNLKWSSASLSEVLKNDLRFDANVYESEAKLALKRIKNCSWPSVPLIGENGFVKSAHYGNRLKRKYISKFADKAVGFIGSSEMLDILPRPIKFLEKSDKTKCMEVIPNTVLLSRSGTIGNLSFANKTISRFLVSEHAMRLECFDYPGYVYAYLKSDLGQTLIQSKVYGAVVDQIEPEHIADIPVINPSKDIKIKINKLIIDCYNNLDKSNDKMELAQKIFISELKLPSIFELEQKIRKTECINTFNVKLSQLDQRLDGSFHIPIADEITQLLISNSDRVISLGDPSISKEVILPGRFKRVYVNKDNGVTFIGGKQIGELDPVNKKYLSRSKHKKRIEEELTLKKDMILITCSGTIGRVALVGKQWEGWTANQHIIRVVAASPEMSGYLYTFLNSDYGNVLITRNTYGSVIDEIDDKQVKNIPVPILHNKSKINEISSLVKEAMQLRETAYGQEQEAIALINSLVSE